MNKDNKKISDAKEFAIAQKELLDFSKKYKSTGWHTWDKNCKLTNNVVNSLVILELIEINEYHQFKNIQ